MVTRHESASAAKALGKVGYCKPNCLRVRQFLRAEDTSTGT